MTGVVLQINVSPGGVPKRPVPEAVVTPLGLEGDAHAHPNIHGGPEQAILLITSEGIDELIAKGYPLFPGAMGENLTTRGLDRRQLRVGQQLRVGTAIVELTKIRRPCSALDAYGESLQREIFDSRVKAGDPDSPRWGLSGFYARVIAPGKVCVNDIIAVVATLA
ncbi:MAG: MOSC domain-containing protein [Bryobacteraceae bacterium]